MVEILNIEEVIRDSSAKQLRAAFIQLLEQCCPAVCNLSFVSDSWKSQNSAGRWHLWFNNDRLIFALDHRNLARLCGVSLGYRGWLDFTRALNTKLQLNLRLEPDSDSLDLLLEESQAPLSFLFRRGRSGPDGETPADSEIESTLLILPILEQMAVREDDRAKPVTAALWIDVSEIMEIGAVLAGTIFILRSSYQLMIAPACSESFYGRAKFFDNGIQVWAAREDLEMNVESCRVILGELSISLEKLLSLREGASLVLSVGQALPVLLECGNAVVARGELRILEDQAVLNILEVSS